MAGSVANLAKSSAIALLVGGLPFSLALLHLGVDMTSPEFLRYVLIASIPLSVVLIGIALRFGSSRLFTLFGEVCWWGLIACVPLEAVTYLYCVWGLKGTTMFSWEELPTLLLMLAIWSFVLVVPSTLIAFAVRGILAESRTS
jgi:hypothetical protein